MNWKYSQIKCLNVKEVWSNAVHSLWYWKCYLVWHCVAETSWNLLGTAALVCRRAGKMLTACHTNCPERQSFHNPKKRRAMIISRFVPESVLRWIMFIFKSVLPQAQNKACHYFSSLSLEFWHHPDLSVTSGMTNPPLTLSDLSFYQTLNLSTAKATNSGLKPEWQWCLEDFQPKNPGPTIKAYLDNSTLLKIKGITKKEENIFGISFKQWSRK